MLRSSFPTTTQPTQPCRTSGDTSVRPTASDAHTAAAARWTPLTPVPLALGVAVVDSSLYDVPGGFRAVMFDRFTGVKPTSTGEGTHLLIPGLQRAILYDCRIKPRVSVAVWGEGQRAAHSRCLPVSPLFSLAATTTELTPEHLDHHRLEGHADGVAHAPCHEPPGHQRAAPHLPEPGPRVCRPPYPPDASYDERVLPSIGNEVLKATVAQFDASELITNREIVSARIRDDLLNRAKEFHIQLEDVSITHMTFGKEFTTAVEQKQIAQQDAERAKFVVEKAEQERQASVIRAEGEAEAASTISAALTKAGDAFVQFKKIETARDIAQSLSQNRNVAYVPSQNGNLLLQVPPQPPAV